MVARDWLAYMTVQDNVFIQHIDNVGEYLIPGTRYKADGYCEATRTIYEFFGSFWHGDLTVYATDAMNNVIGKTMGELYQKTMKRLDRIKSLGYEVKFIWESEWNQLVKENKVSVPPHKYRKPKGSGGARVPPKAPALSTILRREKALKKAQSSETKLAVIKLDVVEPKLQLTLQVVD